MSNAEYFILGRSRELARGGEEEVDEHLEEQGGDVVTRQDTGAIAF
jgi:hypothetical protein